MYNENVFHIICSFLKPTELTRVRTLNKLYYIWTSNFLRQVYHTFSLQNFTCPKCGNWREMNYGECHDDYYDDCYYLPEDECVNRKILVTQVFNHLDFSRNFFILCDDCERDETDDKNVSFRYRGDRSYKLVIVQSYLYPWAFLCEKNEDCYQWNQYKLFIDPSMHQNIEIIDC